MERSAIRLTAYELEMYAEGEYSHAGVVRSIHASVYKKIQPCMHVNLHKFNLGVQPLFFHCSSAVAVGLHCR